MMTFLNLTPPLIPGEVGILKAINGWHSPIADAFMYMISNTGAWIPVVAVLLYYLFSRKPWQEAVLFILSVGLCILICDRLSAGFAKPFFARPRPTHLEGLGEYLHIVFGYKGAAYGFFSGHASNFIAVAMLMSRTIRDRLTSFLIFGIVLLVAYSRMYLGVHFLSDILMGFVVGLSAGYFVSLLHQVLRRRFSPSGYRPSKEVFAAQLGVWRLALMLFLPVLLAYSWQVARILKMVGAY
ncbi:MAG: phosphatase PAP2 family protein [Porphyromonadaceae bacterium]|nr:phosphatase PAP2 family protein [Porphyromonadaceae bacterium]